jgi:hypothetical protein
MRKVIVVILAVLALVVGMAVPAMAATEQVITITATPSFLSMAFTYTDAHDSSWGVGLVTASTNGYWWDDEGGAQAAAADPVVAGDCAGLITNDGSIAIDVDLKVADWTGGAGWTIEATVGEDEVVMKGLAQGMANEAAYLVLTNNDQELITALAADAAKGVDIHLETGTFTDDAEKSTSATYTVRTG